MANSLYSAHNLNPAYLLRYSWTAFPSKGQSFPSCLTDALMDTLAESWEADGLRLLERRWDERRIQVTFSATPQIAPEFLAARAKGRLQHALRQAGNPVAFARNFSVRALGNNTRETVERYVCEQVERGDFADAKYREGFMLAAWSDPEIDLRQPSETSRGRYWYGLHLVLVTSDRFRINAETTAQTISEGCRAVAAENLYQLSGVAVMPDHLHLVLQGAPAHSPEEIVLRFQNQLARKLGQVRIWESNYYAGTAGEYTMHAVRR